MKKLKNEKGITLVSLVITIIVLIILAAVSINLTIGSDGIITRAKEAAENMEVAALEEQEMLNTLYGQLDGSVENGGLAYDKIAQLKEQYDNLNSEYTNFKSTIAQAITNAGIETEETATAQTMAENISNLGGNTINTTGITSGTFTGNLMEIETGFKPTGIAILAPNWANMYSFSTMCVNSSWRASFTDSGTPSNNYINNNSNKQEIVFTNSGFTVASQIGNGGGTFHYVTWDETRHDNIATGSFTGKATVDCGFKPTGIAILAPNWANCYTFSTMYVNSSWRASFTDSGTPSNNYTNTSSNKMGITFTDTGFSVANHIGNGAGTFYYVAWKE